MHLTTHKNVCSQAALVRPPKIWQRYFRLFMCANVKALYVEFHKVAEQISVPHASYGATRNECKTSTRPVYSLIALYCHLESSTLRMLT